MAARSLLPVLLLGADLGLLVLLGSLGVHLAAALTLLALLTLLSLLGPLVLGAELARLRVTGLVFGLLVLELPELLGVAPVLSALGGAATLLTGEAGLLPARLLRRGDVPLLLSRLLAESLRLRLPTRLLGLWLLAELLRLGLLTHLLALRLLILLRLGLLGLYLLGLGLLTLRLLTQLLGLGLLAHLLGLWLLTHLLALRLLRLLRLGLLTQLLCLGLLTQLLLGALRSCGQELTGLGVTGSLLGDLAHPLAELLGVAPVLGALVGAATLLTGEAGLLPARLLSRGDGSLLLCRLLVHPLLGLVHLLLLLERFLSV
ncbi:hypothetical protein [Halosimplex pelagicum]|uniref:Uncharacterized protein n=1 Tax=Halosimplex pelagicum TaxID=869886 RepID=A0A7D5PCF4_9EURY|nr:hypothetical protein [Halosimplex pelagicum]QLH83142.1 hypothetical protein HZS54_16575 [Halosimplex pelagicum]